MEGCKQHHSRFWKQLLDWARRGGLREFPWRVEREAYRIVVAETIIRRTGADRAVRPYEEFLRRWPSVEALAAEDDLAVAAFFRQLGMPGRGILLRQAAERVVREHAGVFPASRRDLMRLPGVGSYIADAVLCFAYGIPVVPVDAGVARVAERALGLKSRCARPWTDAELRARLCANVPSDCVRVCAYALIDVAALYCRPKAGRCTTCPIGEVCLSLQKGREVRVVPEL